MKYLENALAVNYSDVAEAKEALSQFFELTDIVIDKTGIWLGGLQLYKTSTDGKEFAATKEFMLPKYRNNLFDVYLTCEKFGYVDLLCKFAWHNIASHKEELKEKVLLLSEYGLKPDKIPKTWCEQYTPIRLKRTLKNHYTGKFWTNRHELKR